MKNNCRGLALRLFHLAQGLTPLIVSILIGLILFVIIGEIYARFTCKEVFLTGLKKDNSIFHHLPAPYYKNDMRNEDDFDASFITNNRGMRGPGDYVYEKANGIHRIAILGDSFTFGVGVKADETFSSLMQKMLDKLKSKKYQVYNFGVYSYSPILEYIYLKEEVMKYKPDAVILMLDISDIQDDYYYEPHIIRNKIGEIASCDPFLINGRPDLRAFLMKHSRLFMLLDQKLFQSIAKIQTLGFKSYVLNKLKHKRNKLDILLNPDIDNIAFDRLMLARPGKNRAIIMRSWERTGKYIRMMKDLCDENNIKFTLIIYPYGHQVGEDQWGKGRLYWGFEEDLVYDARDNFSIVKDFAAKNNIPYVDITDKLIKHNNEMLYFRKDGHWTKRGNEVVAEALYDERDMF